MRVSKWGNSLAIRLPTLVVEALELKEGDDIEIHVAACESFDLLFRQNSRTLNRTLQWGDCDHLVRVSPLAGRAVEMG